LTYPFLCLRISEIVACLTGFFYFKKFKKTSGAVFIFYLLFIVLCENLVAVLNFFADHKFDYFIDLFYRFFVIPVEFVFYYWLFFVSFKNSTSKWLPIVCAGIYIVSLVSDFLYFNKINMYFDSISYTIGNLLLLVLILRFFINLVTSNSILDFKRNPMFWISLGLLVYYLGSFPFYGLFNLLSTKHSDWFNAYFLLSNALDCVMYLLFAISFIC